MDLYNWPLQRVESFSRSYNVNLMPAVVEGRNVLEAVVKSPTLLSLVIDTLASKEMQRRGLDLAPEFEGFNIGYNGESEPRTFILSSLMRILGFDNFDRLREGYERGREARQQVH